MTQNVSLWPRVRAFCQALVREADITVDALNWMAWYASKRPNAPTGVRRLQTDVHDRICSLVRRCRSEADIESPEAAARTLLRGRLDRYGGTSADHLTFAAFRPGLVPIPDSVKGSPFLSSTFDTEAKLNLEAGQQRMLRSE